MLTSTPGTPARTVLRDRLVRYLMRELAAARDDVAETLSLPIEERIERGYCIENLRFQGEDKAGRLVFECADNPSKFRAGDRLTLGSGENPERGGSVVFASYDPSARILRVERDRWKSAGWEGLDLGGPLVLDRTGSDFGRLALEAVDMVYSGDTDRSMQIRGILERREPQTTPHSEKQRAEEAVRAFRLDERQREAFIAAYATFPFHLIQGPPGSGKTHLIACLVASLAGAGQRILVSAYTHRAVNNALRAINVMAPAVSALKAGEDHNADDLPRGIGRVRSISKAPAPPPGVGQVVGATVFALKSVWGAPPFDRAIFDEAAQIPVPHAICGMLAARRYIFVGDHRQLGPIVVGCHADPIASLSIFAHLVGEESLEKHIPASARPGYPRTILGTTYRMNAGITAFPSRQFYDGKLVPAPGAAARRFPLVRGGPFDALLDPERPAIIATMAHEGYRSRCLPEATLAAELLEDLLIRQHIDPTQIAAVAPFRAQTNAIRHLLALRLGAARRSAGAGIVIDTVERIQGQEREVVIVSLTCSEPEYAAREAAFFFSPNRLNVTLTRAKTKLVLIASPHLFIALPPDLEGLKNASLFVRLFRELPRVDLTAPYLRPDL